MTSTHETLHVLADTLPLSFSDQGRGRPFLVLHGGAGPTSMSGLAERLSRNSRAILPTHPGFAGQPRPLWLDRVADLAQGYLALLEALDVREAILIGNSIGGWIAAEMAVRHSPRVAGLVMLNPVGIEPASSEGPIVNPATLPPAERAAYAFHNPERFALVPSTPEGVAMMAENQKALLAYAGDPFMHDPRLHSRLAQIAIPSAVIWGESDRIAGLEYGRRFAASIPQSRFERVAEAGHFPHIEQPERVLAAIADLLVPCTREVDFRPTLPV